MQLTIDYPLLTCFGYQSKDKYIFNKISEQIVIDLNSLEFSKNKLFTFFQKANGHNSLAEIADNLKVEKTNLLNFIQPLLEKQILVDSRKFYSYFHNFTETDSPFGYNLSIKEIVNMQSPMMENQGANFDLEPKIKSEFQELLLGRYTCRNFIKKPLDKDLITELFASGIFLNNHRTIPSGGGIYSLQFYLIPNIKDENFAQLAYKYIPEKYQFQEIQTSFLPSNLNLAFGGDSQTYDHPYYLVVTADFDKNNAKYANRGYLYCYIEAGHFAQNIQLYGVQKNIGILEYANFDDSEVSQILNLEGNEKPLLSIIFGHKGKFNLDKIINQSKVSNQINQLKKIYMKPKGFVENFNVNKVSYKGYNPGYYCATSNFAMSGSEVLEGAFAYGSNRAEAEVKCMAESIERYSHSIPRIDLVESTEKVKYDYFDLTKAYPLHPDFFKNPLYSKNFSPINLQEKRSWTKGTKLWDTVQTEIYIPTEIIYFPVTNRQLGHKKYIFANSTGAAAHFDKTESIKNGVLEILERDAFSLLWYAKRKVHKIPHKQLDPVWQEKIKIWQDLGYTVNVWNITTDNLPTVLVMMYNQNLVPAIGLGARCDFSFGQAIQKAFLEAELGFMIYLTGEGEIEKITGPDKITRAFHHPNLYAFGDYYQELKFLINADYKEISEPKEHLAKAIYQTVLEEFRMSYVTIKEPINKNDLTVTKVFSDIAMPLNFGYANEPYKHPRIKKMSLSWQPKYPAFPHFFP